MTFKVSCNIFTFTEKGTGTQNICTDVEKFLEDNNISSKGTGMKLISAPGDNNAVVELTVPDKDATVIKANFAEIAK